MAGNNIYVQGSYVDVHDNEVVNLSIDNAQVHLGEGQIKTEEQTVAAEKRNEELFHFVHPELDEAEAWKVHRAVKRLVEFQKVADICKYMKELKDKGKVLLPESPKTAYEELVRMGMPRGEGFSEKNFSNSYIK